MPTLTRNALIWNRRKLTAELNVAPRLYIQCIPGVHWLHRGGAMAVKLTASDREFFRDVATFVFSNPFSRDRRRLLSRLLPGATIEDLRRDRRALADVVAERVARVDAGGTAKLADFSADDRPHLETAFLYIAYHHFVEDLDRLI